MHKSSLNVLVYALIPVSRGVERGESRRAHWPGPPPLATPKSAAVNLHRLARLICPFFLFPLPPPALSGEQILTFSVSRSFTVGNGVLVDILRVWQAAERCSGLGRHGSLGRSVRGAERGHRPLSTSPGAKTPGAAALHHTIARTRRVSLTSFV